MAASLVNVVRHYQGVSTDAKPPIPPEGSTLHFIDTGEQYIFHDGMWEEDLRLVHAIQQANL